MALERELATYHREKARLLTEGEHGRYALIRGDEVVSTWDTRADALQVGYEKFGLEPFMVQQIQGDERPLLITRLVVPNAIHYCPANRDQPYG